MSTKVNKLKQLYNMRLHKAKSIVNKIDTYLPYTYISEVQKRCKEKKKLEVSSQYIRDVKRYKTKNPVVLEVILEFAVENEKSQKKMEKLVTNQ